MNAVILAGGFGTRLKSIIHDIPKPMAPVSGRPFLEYVMDKLIIPNIEEIVLSIGYRSDVIQNHFRDIYRGVPIHYAIETEPLGTGGAIAFACNGIDKDQACLIINGDTFLDIDYSELIDWYKKSPSSVALVLKNLPDVLRYGAVITEGEHITGFAEKGKSGPGTMNAGVYIIQPSVFKVFGLSGKFSFETEFLQPFYSKLRPRAFVTDGYFIDIGIPEDYEKAQKYFK